MARYNRWMNARLYEAAGQLDDPARKHDRGQALTALGLAGRDIGATDLIAMPGVVEVRD